MKARAEVERETRHRIVTAAVALHERQGIAATSWDDLAAAAAVNRATVYRHFRGLGELIPACARQAFEAIDLPSRSEIEAQLGDLADPRERLARIVGESCVCYERGAGWLRAARREADLIPALADTNRRIGEGVATLVDVALAGCRLHAEARTVLVVLADYPFWQQLIDAGVARADAPRLITRLMEHLVWPKGEPDV
jgi:AcrR family transcriptional regulator